ncbi:MAG: hypothetical protein A2418_03310 [Candidatus Brennerbacteria bacterium RIFOXYC1_FULL_41_11]|uniref:Uncharacterized protein n=1 Tax=Candidatus Brennerbacteria bacterium RIFOXYD1_FULL_41_16 TaxID=1797529 RepID=A0A1G1XKW1_9BACT|nr:MAG: hypothetical protein A2391_00990 [Candidatus Brennerbacteria bacterium RIFOXYB1_FULL_41_13]OGY40106.1 MAG: hypothetical protein A2418_03310 [Candidatus Brennerbacteria bacterium RIFOXYC1_FULL_41_11]OGY40669.1 MAG: hypothetical protein A2570_00855 [Candidatus Brennerbacteria bacterium RIFOXYD1_FULL_41_16]
MEKITKMVHRVFSIIFAAFATAIVIGLIINPQVFLAKPFGDQIIGSLGLVTLIATAWKLW